MLDAPVPDDPAIQALVAGEDRFRHCLDLAGPLPPQACRPAGFLGLLRIILGQQVSVRAADAMWERLSTLIDPVTPEALLALDDDTLRACGLSRQKAGYARSLAMDIVSGRLDLNAVHAMDDEAAIETLIQAKGIGRWSAEMYLLMTLGRPDIWPVDDLAIAIGVQRLLGRAERPPRKELIALGEPWRPYRSTAARLVWHYYRATMPVKAG